MPSVNVGKTKTILCNKKIYIFFKKWKDIRDSPKRLLASSAQKTWKSKTAVGGTP